MASKKPGPKSKTQPQAARQEDMSSSSSSSSSGFLIAPRRPEAPLQQHQDNLPSTSRPRPGVLHNSNPSRSAERDSGFVTREVVTGDGVAEDGAGADKSSDSSRFLDDDLTGEIDAFCKIYSTQNCIFIGCNVESNRKRNRENLEEDDNGNRDHGGEEEQEDVQQAHRATNPTPKLRVKQTARKSTAGRVQIQPPKRIYEDPSRKRQRTSGKVPVKKQPTKRKFRPGVKALQEIRKFQKTTNNLIPALPFSRLAREICQEVAVGQPDLRFQSAAIKVTFFHSHRFYVGPGVGLFQ